MQGFSSAQLVSVWEDGLGLHAIDRALAMLAAAMPAEEWTTLCDLPIGQRDERLLALRARTFGPHVEASAQCPRCGERVQTTFHISDVSSPVAGEPEQLVEDGGGERLRVRPLTSRDLAAAMRCASADEARRLLALRCVSDTKTIGDGACGAPVADERIELIARRLEQIDPAAVRILVLTCPTCHEPWECDLDVAEFLWTEIEAAALRLLRDVHALAHAYGWSEQDILAMTPIRRRAYLELVQ